MFNVIDNFDAKINIFRDSPYMRRVTLAFALSMIPVWLIFGFDSGVGMIEELAAQFFGWLTGSIINPDYYGAMNSIYGMSFHFSSFVIYGLLYYAISSHLEGLGVKHSKNVIYSGCLVMLNIAVFEWVYMGSFAHFQMGRQLTEWFVSDFWFLQQYLNVLFLGIAGLLGVWTESYNGNNRVYKFKFNKKILAIICFTVAMFMLWIFYPFQTESAVIDDWQSSALFPQTHYAYVNSKLYIQNDLLHALNVGVKALFAVSQIFVIKGFKHVGDHSL